MTDHVLWNTVAVDDAGKASGRSMTGGMFDMEPSGSTSSSNTPLVSVVIPSYQSAGHVRSALRALQSQDTSVPYEVIVVDSSSDGTDRIVAEEFPRVRLLHFPDRCQVGTARNIGVAAARGNVILFTDTDTVPCSVWINQMYAAIRDEGADGVSGAMSNGTPWSITGSAGFYLEFFRFLAYNGPSRPVRFLVGGNSGFRREILAGVRYADHSVGEDMLFSSRLARSGKRLLFLPTASVVHLNREGCRNVLNCQHNLGRGAFFYRSQDSPEKVRLLQAVSPLVFLLPFGVMIWIGCSILWRRRVADFLRFVAILPVCFIGNAAWAFGFYGALRQATRHGCPE